MRRIACLLLLSSLGAWCAGATGANEQDWHQVVQRFAAEHFKNPAWGYSHSVRDYELAKALAAADHVTLDDDILFATAYLHDMAAFAPWDREKDGIDHSDEGARVFVTVLRGTDFPEAKLDAVRDAIRTHMYYRTPEKPEAVYLHDADALDWLGAIGVARIFALADPNGGDPDGPKVLKMLEENLAKVPAGVVSPAGKKRLPSLQKELATFLEDLRRETDGYRTL